MYKKNKATKNNSLKKASISAAVATLASVAAFSGSGSFDSNNFALGATRWYDSSRFFKRGLGRGFGKYGRLGSGYLGYYRDQLPTDENQKENFEFIGKVYDVSAQAMTKHLAPQSIYEKLRDSDLGGGPTSFEKILDILLKDEVYDKGKFLLDSRGGVLGPEAMGKSYVYSVKCLKEWRNRLIRLFAKLACIAQLGKLTTKDEDKLEKLKKLAKDGLDAPSELVDAACIKEILRDPALLEKATSIADNGVKLLFNGGSFSDVRTSMNSVVDAWTDLDSDTERRGYYLDRMPKAVRGFRSVLEVILACIRSIDDYTREAYAAITAYGIRKCMGGMSVQPEDESIFFAAGPKSQFAAMSKAVGHPGAFLAPVFAVNNIADKADIDFAGREAVKSSLAKFDSYLSRARKGEVTLKRLVEANHKQAVSDAAKNPGDLGLIYDLSKLYEGVAGADKAKEFLGWFEQIRKDFLADPENYNFFLEKARSRGEAIEEMLTEGKKSFDVNDGSEASNEAHFIGAGGNALPFSVDFTNTLGEETSREIPSGLREAFYSLASMPEMLKGAALLEVLKLPFSSLSSFSSLNYDIESMFSAHDYLAAANEAAGQFDKAFEEVNETLKNMAKIKKEAVSEEEKKKKAKSKVDNSGVIGLLTLDSGNVNTDRYKVSDEGKTLTIENLDADCKFISPVFCPKNSADKAGNVNKDLPVVEVNNGKAVVNMSDVLTNSGRFELHIRKVVKDEATGAIKDYPFLFKLNAVYGADKIKGTKLLEVEKREQSATSLLDFSSARVMYAEDGTAIICIDLNEGVSVSEAPKTLTAVVFKQGVPPNMEHDKMAAQLEGRTYKLYTLPKLEGGYQVHFYNGNLTKESYIGKIEFNSSKLADAATNAGAYTLGDALSKVDRESEQDVPISRVLEVVIPDDAFDNRPDEVSYSVVGEDGKTLRRGSTKLKYIRSKEDKYVFKGTFEFSGAKKSQRIEIDADDGLVLKSDKTVGADTEIGEVVPFVEKTTDRDMWRYLDI